MSENQMVISFVVTKVDTTDKVFAESFWDWEEVLHLYEMGK